MTSSPLFQRARKTQSFLRMAIAGPSGAGKTYTSLQVATGLAAGRPIAVIDTERGSASKYADLFSFDVLELDSYHPERYIEAIEAAAKAGYAVLVIDSLTHAWKGTGGLLEVHEQIVKRQKTPNSYTAWADVTPIQNRLINAITGASLHVIATMRAKTEYVQDKNERGGTTIRKVGMAPEQRDGMEYEFDIFGQMDIDHNLIIEKSRCPALSSAVISKPDTQLAATLATWLQGEPPLAAELPVTSTLATPSPADASDGREALDLRTLALEAGIFGADYGREFYRICGKKDRDAYTAADREKWRKHLLALRDRKRAAEAKVTGGGAGASAADHGGDDGAYDLRDLPTGAGAH